MARPETFDKTMQLRINQELLDNIDDWMSAHGRDWSRSEAIRNLVTLGMRSEIADAGHVNEIKSSVRLLKRVVEVQRSEEEREQLLGLALEQIGAIEMVDAQLAQKAETYLQLRASLSLCRKELVEIIGTLAHHKHVSDPPAKKKRLIDLSD